MDRKAKQVLGMGGDYRFAELLQEGIWVIDPIGKITYVNSYLSKMFGYSVDEMIGIPLIDFLEEHDREHCRKVLERPKSEIKEMLECKLARRDKTIIHARLSITFLYNNNQYNGAIILVTEIEEIKKEQDHSNRQFSEILESITDAFYAVDADWRLVYVNRKTEEYWHCNRDELLGKILWDIFPESKSTMGYNVLHRAAREQISLSFEDYSAFLHLWVEANVYPTADGGLSVYFRDITARKMVEEELCASKIRLEEAQRESEERYQDLFRKSPGAIILHDGERIIDVNPAIGALLGYDSPSDLIGMETLSVIDPDYRGLVSSRIRQILDKEITVSSKEIQLLRRDGGKAYVEAVSGVCHYQGRKIVQVVLHDLTERKNLEITLTNRSLELSHALATLETMLDTIPIGVIVAEADDERVTYISKAAQEIVGVHMKRPMSECRPESHRSHRLLRTDRSEIPPKEWPILRALRNGDYIDNEEIIVLQDDGGETVTLVNCAPVRGEDGRILRAVASMVNITRRRRMENALRESERRFRAITEALPQLVWTADAAGNINYLNSQFYHYTGIPTDELLKQDWSVIVHPEDMEKRKAGWRESIRTGNIYQVEYRIKRQNGEYHWFLGRGLPVRDEEEKIICWFGTCTDIHYQKRLEMELQETNSRLHQFSKQMLTTMEEERGVIARELHDDAGQALTALKIFIELILKGVSPEEQVLRRRISEAVQLTGETLGKIRRLAQDLRPPELDALGLNLTLEDFCRELGQRVGLDIQYQGCEIPMLTDTARITLYRFLQEALTNIIKHAKADLVLVRLKFDLQQVFLTVKDNGIGFNLLHDAVETKGMGLAGMRERLAMQGGKLTIDSKPGRGTCLVAMIPLEVVL